MTSSFSAIAFNGFREARRNRISIVVAGFTIVLLLSSALVTEVTVYTFDRVMTDVGLGAMGLTLVLLSVFFASGQLSKEIERKTIFLIVSKPVSRGVFLLGRFAGTVLTLAALLLMMGSVFLIELALFGTPLSVPRVLAVGMLLVEVSVVCAVGYLMSSFAGQMVSAVVTTGVYFAGHLSGDIYEIASRSESAGIRVLGKAIYYSMPNLSRLNYRPMASHDVLVPVEETLASLGYAAAYVGLLLSAAVLIFSKRDFR